MYTLPILLRASLLTQADAALSSDIIEQGVVNLASEDL